MTRKERVTWLRERKSTIKSLYITEYFINYD